MEGWRDEGEIRRVKTGVEIERDPRKREEEREERMIDGNTRIL